MYRKLHYEYIPGRTNGRCWRVADEEDDYVFDFETENEARDYVRENNDKLVIPGGWKY